MRGFCVLTRLDKSVYIECLSRHCFFFLSFVLDILYFTVLTCLPHLSNRLSEEDLEEAFEKLYGSFRIWPVKNGKVNNSRV